jgi:hypothetical protein
MTYNTRYRRMLNRMGYYDYQNRLLYNLLNQQGRWDEHLENSRRFIIRALEYFKPEKVTVLGSGWLIDLPIAEMIEKKVKICLTDIIHPPDVIRQAGNIMNIEIAEQDVTGGLIEEVWQKAKRYSFIHKLRSLKEIRIPEYVPESDPGLVISLNILTQLESQLIYFLKKRSKIMEEEYDSFRAQIQKKHIDFLKKYRSVLLTDTTEVITDSSGDIKKIPTLVADLPPSEFREEWTWNFDLTGADLYKSRSQFNMVALII